jgi:ribosomal protein S18 acetylase RimI-like enzyme
MTKIRIATAKDIDIIVDFQLRMALETENLQLNPEIVKNGVSSVFSDNSKGNYYVAEVYNQVIASLLTTYEWSDWRNSTILWLQSVYVLHDYRKQGIFRQMFLFIQEIVNSSEKYCGIKLYVDKTNTKAQKVYESVGMNGEHYITYEWMK